MRQMTLPLEHCEMLYRFIWKTIADMECVLKRVGGIQNHIHLLIELNPSIALATFVRNLKSFSSGWLRQNSQFPKFLGWTEGYYACTLSPKDQDSVINYIKAQKEHHKQCSFDEELNKMYQYAQLELHDRDLR